VGESCNSQLRMNKGSINSTGSGLVNSITNASEITNVVKT